MSIKAKLSLLLVCWSLLILLIANAIIYFSYVKLTENREMENLKEIGEGLLEKVNTNDLFSPSMRPLLQSVLRDDGMIRIIDKENQVIIRTGEEDDLFNLPINHSAVNDTDMIRLDGDMIVVFTAPIFKNNQRIGTIELSRVLDDHLEDIEILLTILIGVSVLLIVLAVFFGKITSRIFLRPVSVIGTTMDNIQKYGLFEKIQLPQKKHDEIFQLADNFNRMIDYLEEIFQKQEQFISDASHELKTPLTVIENYASMLNRWGKDNPDLLNEGIETIQDESKRIKNMVEQLLDLAAINKQPFEIEVINITELCKQTAKRLEVATNRSIRVINDSKSILGLSNKEKFVQILFILLDNALKYSQKEVTVKVSQNEDRAVIQIMDQGIGIPENDIPRLFERFYRVDKSRTRATGGRGLGLAIAYSLIKQSDGFISIESELNKGTIVTVTLKASM
ncbi:HAMP domain-containing histidine kinase [Bacillus badius]|uniref:Signal transduction histidine-protein kinase ArlS n=1 Tax=Bacillus badius TaxID=1455 RepID=A0ABR5APF1_BACBA|nr:HAMP domain-containing histidine kinase [Bacillus badius]KIL74204.1 sensor histidine kinase [Bacillus badius]MED0668595.1 HAMP domain-containing histidine kinase [Bacillus badius]MED4717150.1 HAMP domain-containing histidine kinase [Bacillus badius]